MTLSEIVTQAQDDTSDYSDKAKRIIIAGVNRGLTKMRAKLNRNFTLVTKKFSWVEGQGKYQAPEDIIRGGEVYATIDGVRTPLTQVDDINEWDALVRVSTTADRPEYVFWHESDIFEVYPKPDADVANGGALRYQSRARPLSQDDYTTGDVSLTNGSATVTGNSTVWDSDMVGRFLKLADGNTHLQYYRIIDVASTTELTLENHWGGATVSGKSYKIGEQPNLPAEYHISLVDAGVQRYLLHRKDTKLAKEYGDNFTVDVIQAESDYEGLTHSKVIESKRSPNKARKFDNLNEVRDI